MHGSLIGIRDSYGLSPYCSQPIEPGYICLMEQQKINLELSLDREDSRDLRLQICTSIRAQIETGVIPAGSRLPPSRELAASLPVARKTVAEAYKQLLKEGFLVTRGKGGTFVKEVATAATILAPEQQSQRLLHNLSEYGQAVRSLKLARIEPRENIEISLFSSAPTTETATAAAWFEKAFHRTCEPSAAMYSALGHRTLRQAISEYLSSSRGVYCDEDEIAIFTSFPQIIDLVLRLHVSRGDRVVVEDPCYPAMRESATAYGADIIPVDVDSAGLQVDRLPPNSKQCPAKVLFLTAAHQFPTGAVLTIERRHKILQWASAGGTVVVDDDYDSDFFLKGFPPPALKSLPQSEQVIYVSSFKKLVPPGCSIDFAVLPRALVDLYCQSMKLSVSAPSMRIQAVLAEFIKSGEIFRQIRRMKTIYASRHQRLCEALKQRFGSCIHLSGAPCGLDMLVRIESRLSDSDIVRRAFQAGVEVETTKDFYCRKRVKGEFIIGYGSIPDDSIDEAVRRFARAAGID